MIIRVLFGIVLSILCGFYLLFPEGSGRLAFFGTALGGLIAFVIGPLVRKPARKAPGRWLRLAGLCFLVGLLLRLEVVIWPTLLGSPDLWTFAGYGGTAMFLVSLLRQVPPNPNLWRDTLSVTIGCAMVGLAVSFSAQWGLVTQGVSSIIITAAYPVLDGILLALTAQLIVYGWRSFTLLGGLIALSAGDLAYTFIWAIHPGSINPYANILYMISYALLGLMAVSPPEPPPVDGPRPTAPDDTDSVIRQFDKVLADMAAQAASSRAAVQRIQEGSR